MLPVAKQKFFDQWSLQGFDYSAGVAHSDRTIVTSHRAHWESANLPAEQSPVLPLEQQRNSLSLALRA